MPICASIDILKKNFVFNMLEPHHLVNGHRPQIQTSCKYLLASSLPLSLPIGWPIHSLNFTVQHMLPSPNIQYIKFIHKYHPPQLPSLHLPSARMRGPEGRAILVQYMLKDSLHQNVCLKIPAKARTQIL